jgi:imidazolonepropionase-like amidohydrolase
MTRPLLAVMIGLMLATNAAAKDPAPRAGGTLVVRGGLVYTGRGAPITDGGVVVENGRITQVGPFASLQPPAGVTVLQAAVVTPGLIDARATAGLTGMLNVPHDQDMLDRAAAVQPELRALDAYNPQDELVAWLRSLGVTTLHTGFAPGPPLSGQTMIVKTWGATADEAALVPAAAVAVTLSPPKGFGGAEELFTTRAKTVAVLRQDLIKAREYRDKLAAANRDRKLTAPDRDLHLESLARVLDGELALMVTAHRVRDIAGALRLQREFKLRLWLDGAAEAHQLLPELKAAGVPVLLHPTMARPSGELENAAYSTAGLLQQTGIPFAFTSGYESYVPKVRVVLFEAAVAVGHGLDREAALEALTIGAASLLGVDDRVGSLEKGKDGDLALFDGDPFEYTTHSVGTVIDGRLVSEIVR